MRRDEGSEGTGIRERILTDQHRPSRGTRFVRPRYLAAAGVLLFTVGLVAFMGIVTAEVLYPGGYSTSRNEISDLGGTEPPDSIVKQPSARIFDTTMTVCGVLMLAGAFCIERAFRGAGRTPAVVLIALCGLGILGVGIFPGGSGNIHGVFALLTFFAGGIAAILSFTIETRPFSYFSVLLGAVSLVMLLLQVILGDANPVAGLGVGGVERWVTYPILFWITGLGAHLMGRAR